ncbi:MAG: DUF4432 family protein [Symbiobacterium sp.]|uniref:DUF4432 family protein n=1 Tax=Symbiobacterium sp. TaxID=1971213 RepID=UPI003463B408
MPSATQWQWTRAELFRKVANPSQLLGLLAAEYTDGPARGMRFLQVRSGGGLSATLHPDRALDIGLVEVAGTPISWISPVGPVNPLLSWGDDRPSFQRSFGGGMMVTCGMRHFGAPVTIGDESFPTHGRVHSLPASNVRWGTDWNESRIWVEGVVRETRMGAERLELHRRIEVPIGGTEILVTDRIENVGFREERLEMLYHINLGFPLLDEETSVQLDQAEVDLSGQSGGLDFQGLDGSRVRVTNPALPFAVEITASLPNLMFWYQPDPGMNVLAVEPYIRLEAPLPPRSAMTLQVRITAVDTQARKA